MVAKHQLGIRHRCDFTILGGYGSAEDRGRTLLGLSDRNRLVLPQALQADGVARLAGLVAHRRQGRSDFPGRRAVGKFLAQLVGLGFRGFPVLAGARRLVGGEQRIGFRLVGSRGASLG